MPEHCFIKEVWCLGGISFKVSIFELIHNLGLEWDWVQTAPHVFHPEQKKLLNMIIDILKEMTAGLNILFFTILLASLCFTWERHRKWGYQTQRLLYKCYEIIEFEENSLKSNKATHRESSQKPNHLIKLRQRHFF